MFNYNIGITRLWNKSKRVKSSTAAVTSSHSVSKKVCLGVLRSSNVFVEQTGLVVLKDARIVNHSVDSSSLFHALSYCMWYSGVVTSDHDELSGFELRENICNFLRDNGEVLVSLTPDIVRTISEALLMDGSSCEAYYRRMLNKAEWGGSFEIAILAECFL